MCSHHFNKEQISTDSHMSGDPVYFAWDNQRKLLAWGRGDRDRSAKPQMSESTANLHVMFCSTQVTFIGQRHLLPTWCSHKSTKWASKPCSVRALDCHDTLDFPGTTIFKI